MDAASLSPFEGVWLIEEEYRLSVGPWLKALRIQDGICNDAEGDLGRLTVWEGKVLLEGGQLWVQRGLLHRRGKTGKTIAFRRATNQEQQALLCFWGVGTAQAA